MGFPEGREAVASGTGGLLEVCMKKKMMLAMLALVVVVASAFADPAPAPLGTMETFDLAQVSTTVVPLIYQVITIVGALLGACFGFVILRWGYRKVVSMLK